MVTVAQPEKSNTKYLITSLLVFGSFYFISCLSCFRSSSSMCDIFKSGGWTDCAVLLKNM